MPKISQTLKLLWETLFFLPVEKEIYICCCNFLKTSLLIFNSKTFKSWSFCMNFINDSRRIIILEIFILEPLGKVQESSVWINLHSMWDCSLVLFYHSVLCDFVFWFMLGIVVAFFFFLLIFTAIICCFIFRVCVSYFTLLLIYCGVYFVVFVLSSIFIQCYFHSVICLIWAAQWE